MCRHNGSQHSIPTYATNPRNPKSRFSQQSMALPPLENRNSAPEIVVTATPSMNLGNGSQQRRVHSGLEEKIHRAKAKVQSGFHTLQSSGSNSSHSLHSYSKPKLSSRFQSAQKLNSKLLTNFSTSVKRSRTFNISDVQDELANIGLSKTLPRKQKLRKSSKGSRNSVESSPENCLGHSYGSSSISFDSSSTASSRKSSNSSTNDAKNGPKSTASSDNSSTSTSTSLRTEVSAEAMAEIAAWEDFANAYFSRVAAATESLTNGHGSLSNGGDVGGEQGKGGGKIKQPWRTLSSVDMTDVVV